MTAPASRSRTHELRQSALSGIAMMLASMAIFGLANAFSKWAVATYPPSQVFFIRGFAAVLVLLPFVARDNFAALRYVPRTRLQVLRVVLSVADGMLFFTAIKYLPLADATTCYLAAPIFVTALSAVFLRERVGWRRWLAVVIGFIGVIIALRPTGASFSWPALIALGGCVCQSVFMLVTRQVHGTSGTLLSFTQIVGSFAFGGALSTVLWVPPTWLMVGLLMLSGVVNVGGVLCLNRALKMAPASVVVPFQYTMIIWAVVLGYLAFGDVPSLNTMLGAAIVAGAGIYIFMRERAVAQREPEPAAPPAA